MEQNKNRSSDYGVGKLIHLSPLIGGIILTLVSVGGYIATIQNIQNRVVQHDKILEAIQFTQTAQVGINAKLTEIVDEHGDRLKSMENWRNGVNSIYIPGRRHTSGG